MSGVLSAVPWNPGTALERRHWRPGSKGRVWSGQARWLPAKGPSLGQGPVESASVQGRFPVSWGQELSFVSSCGGPRLPES